MNLKRKVTMLLENKKIFWDMDETLGFFRHVHYELTKKELPDYFPNLGIRSGIKELLSELKEKNITNYITTSSGELYADEVLKRTDLKKYFEEIFTVNDFPEIGSPKSYFRILKHLGVERNNARKDVLIIGNSIYDSPGDVTDIVTILDESCYLRDSELTKLMINMLLKEGKGNFSNGFYKLYATSQKMSSGYEHIPDIGKIFLDNGTELNLKLNFERDYFTKAPIFEVKKGNYYNNLEQFKVK